MRIFVWLVLAGPWGPLVLGPSGQAQQAQAQSPDRFPLKEAYLDAADHYVLTSEKYLHHTKLVRGQKGVGRTCLHGTDIVLFQAEILSVMRNWNPHQDVILARLSTQNLESTGVIAGMSGSPVYIKGPDGKERMIGAVAYGWRGQKEALCGIQPISQMLAVAAMQGKIRPLPAPATQPAAGGKTATAPAPAPAGPGQGPTGPPGGRPAATLTREQFLKTFLNPEKTDFATLFLPARPAAQGPLDAGLTPLATPLMVRGLGERSLRALTADLEALNLVPVQAGGVGPGDRSAARKGPDYAPGSAIAVAMVTGDADMSGVGTVTEVVDDHVLAFGHAMFGEGEVSMPMGPAWVHGVVSTIMGSFKLGACIELTGTLSCDEKVGICGISNQKPRMIPFEMNVDWKEHGGKRKFRFEVAQHRMLTAALIRSLAGDATTTWQEVPELHTVRHDLTVDFGELGTFRSQNISSMTDIRLPLSDLGRAVAGMMNNPFGPGATLQKIQLDLSIERGTRLARIVDLRLDGQVFRPGQSVTGKLVVQPFRGDRATVPIRLDLPADLVDGPYSLTACSNMASIGLLQREKPHRFDPRTEKELLASLQEVLGGPGDQVYLRMPLKRGGLALNKRELGDLPEHRSALLAEAARVDGSPYAESLVQTQRVPYVLEGAAGAEFQVRKEIRETILRP